jgi:hypothetical protein
MKTRIISRNCILNDKDSFWVECTDDEVTNCILPYVKENLEELMQEITVNRGHSLINTNANEQIYCNFFLVSTDCTKIKSYGWVLPFGGMWNGGNPFEEIDVVDFHSLDELQNIWERIGVKRKQ